MSSATSVRYRAVQSKHGVLPEIRRAEDLQSPKCGTLAKGEVFEALEEIRGAHGQRRARMSRGWVSIRETGASPRRPICVAEAAVQALLSGVPSLRDLSASARSQVAEQLEAVEVAEGKEIVSRGTSEQSLYLIEQGLGCVREGDTVGKEILQLHWFGEDALVYGAPHQATIVASQGPTRCLKLTKAVFESVSTILPDQRDPEPEPEPQGPAELAMPESEMDRVLDTLEIDFQELTIDRRIGSGASGVVHKGSHNGQDVAVKIFSTQDEMSDDEMKEFREEVKWLSTLRCTYVVLLVGVCTVVPNMSVITEYLPRGSVYDLIHRQRVEIDFRRRMRMLLDVIKGMQYLEAKNVIHRDLKSQNLLVDRSWKVKIADFGLARLLQSSNLKTINGGAGTPGWMAPEVLRDDPVNSKADVYSFGVVAWEMVVQRIPWHGLKTPQIIFSVGLQGGRLELNGPEMTSQPQLRAICDGCFQEDPNGRPTFARLSSLFEDYMRQLLKGNPAVSAGSVGMTGAPVTSEEGTPPHAEKDPKAAASDNMVLQRAPSLAQIQAWGPEEVSSWLIDQGLQEDVVQIFKNHRVTGPHLLDLTKQEIKDDLGITQFATIKMVQAAVGALTPPPPEETVVGSVVEAVPPQGSSSTLEKDAPSPPSPGQATDSPPRFGTQRNGGGSSGTLASIESSPGSDADDIFTTKTRDKKGKRSSSFKNLISRSPRKTKEASDDESDVIPPLDLDERRLKRGSGSGSWEWLTETVDEVVVLPPLPAGQHYYKCVKNLRGPGRSRDQMHLTVSDQGVVVLRRGDPFKTYRFEDMSEWEASVIGADSPTGTEQTSRLRLVKKRNGKAADYETAPGDANKIVAEMDDRAAALQQASPDLPDGLSAAEVAETTEGSNEGAPRTPRMPRVRLPSSPASVAGAAVAGTMSGIRSSGGAVRRSLRRGAGSSTSVLSEEDESCPCGCGRTPSRGIELPTPDPERLEKYVAETFGAKEPEPHCNLTYKKHTNGNVSISLREMEVTDRKITELAELLPLCHTLTSLNLRDNQIGSLGADALARALPKCCALEKLCLFTNRVGESGAVAIADEMPRVVSLKELDLTNNGIGDAGVIALAGCLPNCTVLEALILHHNGICDEGAQVLAAAVDKCDTLRKLEFVDTNDISLAVQEALGKLAKLGALSKVGEHLQQYASPSLGHVGGVDEDLE